MRRIWRGLAIFIVGGVVGTGFGVALGFFLFPYVFPPPPANHVLTEADQVTLVATGTFIHANPSDPVHWGMGNVSVYGKVVFLEPGFEVGPGPAYHIYLASKDSIRSSGDFDAASSIDLGQLLAFKGSQRYPIPDNVDVADYSSVVIWCEAFSVLISPADLSATISEPAA